MCLVFFLMWLNGVLHKYVIKVNTLKDKIILLSFTSSMIY